jgi:murein DD-endopeptidase MepM/ murein hydrolase activator NlpD
VGKTPQRKQKKYKPDIRRIVSVAICVLLALALVLPLLSTAILSARAATQTELKNQISGLKSSASEAAAKKKELQAQLDAIKSDKAQAMQQHQILAQQLAAIDAQIANTQSQIDTYTQLIQAEEVALAEAQDRETAAYTRFCQRARSMEESGDISYWSVLFSASDFSDLLDRLAMVDLIMEYDNSVVVALVAAKEEVEATLTALNESRAGLEEQRAQQEEQRAEQDAKVQEAQEILDELKKDAAAAEALVAAEEAEEKKIAAEISKKEKELDRLIASQQITFDPGTGYLYPLPASNNVITSRFGPRTHPITKKYHNHSGTDIAAPGGTNVKAVQGGVVATSAYAPNSYGEYVVINHGNGISTLYAHMQRGSRKVKEGDVVSQGQVLGLVGSTGSSTGNHLHLELRKNGVRQNALTMFPGMTFDFRD